MKVPPWFASVLALAAPLLFVLGLWGQALASAWSTWLPVVLGISVLISGGLTLDRYRRSPPERRQRARDLMLELLGKGAFGFAWILHPFLGYGWPTLFMMVAGLVSVWASVILRHRRRGDARQSTA